MTWEQRAFLFNDVLGIIAEVTNGSPRRLVQEEVSSREGGTKQFVAGASDLLAGLLLELAQAHGEDVAEAATSPYCALLLASCPIDAFADAGLAYFKRPGGVAKLEALLDQLPTFRS
jgi:hypothetical protein